MKISTLYLRDIMSLNNENIQKILHILDYSEFRDFDAGRKMKHLSGESSSTSLNFLIDNL